MSIERSEPTFGRVSRLKGTVFEYLSLGASVTGIVALGVLLIYVAIDAFDLVNASPEWLLTYYVTLVLPLIGFCLYSANDRSLIRRTAFALGGGLVAMALTFSVVESFVRPIPRLTWQVAYLFVVVAPVTAYVVFVGSREPIGRTGFGLVGRVLGGTALGLSLIILFTVFDERLWFLAYTLGVLPAVGVLAYSRVNPSSPVSLLPVPVALVGFVAASVLRGPVDVYPTAWLIYVWTLVVPVSAIIAGLTAQRDGETKQTAAIAGVAAFALIGGGSLAAGSLGVSSEHALLVLLGSGVPTVMFGRRVVASDTGRVGLFLPVLLVGGALAGALIAESFGFPAPDPWLDASFVTSSPSRMPERAGLYPAIVGSVLVIAFVALLSFVLGVGSAVFLEEYTVESGVVGATTRLIQINIANLAAVPSVVYGLLGLGLFANLLGLGFGSVVTAALTLSLLILPITVISAQEAIRSVPDHLRQGSYAMGATRWQTTKNVVLPEALPGIFTGTILALGRAIGETAPLIMIGAAHTVFSPPNGIWSKISAMPMQIFVWSDFPQAEFRYGVLAAGVVTLLIVLLGMNATAIILRNKYESGV
ncbi:phosphate ABC transporter membrane protein 2, PhoT family [Halobiforma haloterrestris]|uniref:Phosphate transport system permease protein PstA n=1 Tax=Natronobacterium haloterrestre TaxID=148448 RepID=A0A1I1G2X9_NATHA|nr:phosphate ABC transporter permease PstA [Halobiforma haloterrestris]SFC05871.1 phosphate ABC transporter membrane protein 2, PhoT family [Halobiforma haloterrestris]